MDQCSQNNGCCSQGATCHPTESGAAKCACQTGFKLVNDGHQCVSENDTACGDDQFTCGNGAYVLRLHLIYLVYIMYI